MKLYLSPEKSEKLEKVLSKSSIGRYDHDESKESAWDQRKVLGAHENVIGSFNKKD